MAPGSLADRAGLQENDRVQTIAGRNAESVRHAEAQDSILHAGNNLDLIVTRSVSFTDNFLH